MFTDIIPKAKRKNEDSLCCAEERLRSLQVNLSGSLDASSMKNYRIAYYFYDFFFHRCSDETTRLSTERDRSIRAEDEFWDDKSVTSLRVLALRVIASTWKDNPILEELPTCEDRDMLMEILPIDLPFKLVIKKIEDEQYWERCSRNRQVQGCSSKMQVHRCIYE